MVPPAPEPERRLEPEPGVRIEPFDGVEGSDVPSTAAWGRLVVPEDRTRPHGPTVSLPYVLIPASGLSASRPPVVFMAGGPGGAAFAGVRRVLALLDGDRDLIVLEQRGGRSSVPTLHSTAVTRADLANYATADDPRVEALRLARPLRTALEGFITDGHDPARFTAFDTARDVVSLRRTLDLERYIVYGVSWATLVFEYVAGIDADALEGVALDSALAPRGDAQDRSIGAVRGILGDEFFDRLVAAKAHLDAEPFVGTAPSPLDDDPIDYRITGDDFYSLVQQLLYRPGAIGGVDRVLALVDGVASADPRVYAASLRGIVPGMLARLASNDVVQYWTVTLQDDTERAGRAGHPFRHSWFALDEYLRPALADLLHPSPDAPATILDYDGPVAVFALSGDPVTPVDAVQRWFRFEEHPGFELIVAEGVGHGALAASATLRERFRAWLAALG